MTIKIPIVSIIIPFYNLGEYLEEAIKSCLNQTYKNIEIIVVNDGSTDEKSIEILLNLKIKYKNKVKFIDQKNQGVSKARNNGIKISKGEYICCLDADDKLGSKYIELTANRLAKTKELGFVTTWVQEFGLRNNIWKTCGYRPDKLLTDNCVHEASLFKKIAWEKTNGYKEGLDGHEDWEFWINIYSKGFKWEVIKKVLFNYRIRENSMLTKSRKKRINLINKIVKYHSKLYKNSLNSIVPNLHKELENKVIEERKNLNLVIKELENKLIDEKNINEIQSKLVKNQKIKLSKNKIALDRSNKKINKLETDLLYANESISLLQNDIYKILNTRGWQYLERARNLKKKIAGFNHNLKFKSRAKIILNNIKTVFIIQDIKFTIGIPIYNHSEYLDQCIQSCLNQTYKNFEIIATDDHSNEKEIVPILKKYEKQYPNKIKCIYHQKNMGISSTINEQILESKSNYYVFLDCDDYIEKNALYEVFKTIKTNKSDYIFTDRNHVDEKGNFLFKVELGGYKQLFDKGLNMNEILPLGMAASHMKTIKLSLFKNVGLNSNYFSIPGTAGCQDYDFALRSLLNNCKFQYLDRALYNHRWHSKSITINNNGQQTQLRDMVQRLFQVRRYLSNIQLINNKPKPETKRKHVLFIVPYLVTGGAERWLLNLSSFLKSQKYLVTIFTTNGSGEWEQKAKHVCDNLIINNVETETQENVIQKLIDYVNKHGVDLVHISNSETGYVATKILAEIYPKPKIVDTVHSDKSGFINYSSKYSSYIDQRITVSKITQQMLLKNNLINSNSVSTIYNACDLEIVNKIPKKKNIISYIGRLSEEKNPQLFIDICNALSKQLADYTFQIVGDGPLFDTLKQKNKNKKIIFLGRQNNLTNIYKLSKYVLITSNTEGLPLVLAEAMSQGCIVVSTPVGGIPEIIEHNKNGLLCLNKNDFIKNITRLEKLPNKINSIAKEAIKTASNKLSLNNFGNNYIQIYNQLMADNTITGRKQKLTSICILTLNRYKALDNLLTSLKKYTKLPCEILILDQNSDMDTKKYLKSLTDKKIKVFYSDKNLGCSGGRKYLIGKTKGDYIVQLDNDLEVREGWLEKLISSIEWNDKIGGACGRVTFPNGKTEYNGASYSIDGNYITYTLDDNGKNINDLSLLIENYSMWLPGGATIFKSSVFKDEIYDEKFLNGFEDNDLSFRLEKHGWKFVNCPTCVFIHNHRMFLSDEDLKRDERYLKQRNDFSRTKASFLRFYEKHKLIIKNPELWKLMGFSEKKEIIEKELRSITKK